jgi:transcriptional regulator with XRE-family HTH domain
MNQDGVLVYDTTELGAQIRQLRKTKGLQQTDLAERLGVTRMTISRLERGDSVSIDTALRALSECGYAVTVVPKFSRVRYTDAE